MGVCDLLLKIVFCTGISRKVDREVKGVDVRRGLKRCILQKILKARDIGLEFS
jgi:hypothetical protein